MNSLQKQSLKLNFKNILGKIHWHWN